MYTSVGPPHLWEDSPDFLSYVATLLFNGIEYPVFRRMLYVCATIVYLVAGFPFLLFKVPVLGPAMFGLRKVTGYDRAGNVRAVMTSEELHAKYEKEQKEKKEGAAEDSTILGRGKSLIRQPTAALQHAPFKVSKKVHLPKFGKSKAGAPANEEDKAATAIQSRIRGRKARQATAKAADTAKTADADAAASDAKDVEKSATTIQSLIRGRQARRSAAAAKKADASQQVASSQSETAEASQSSAAEASESKAGAKTPRSPRMSLSRMRRSSKSQK